MDVKFGSVSISEIGRLVSSKLRENGITTKSDLFVYVNEDDFKKIDEDLFYRNKKDDSEKFVPSDGEIIVNFELVNIVIKKV